MKRNENKNVHKCSECTFFDTDKELTCRDREKKVNEEDNSCKNFVATNDIEPEIIWS